ncbi:hypothetical protein D3C85_1382310 [compost metagenome]
MIGVARLRGMTQLPRTGPELARKDQDAKRWRSFTVVAINHPIISLCAPSGQALPKVNADGYALRAATHARPGSVLSRNEKATPVKAKTNIDVGLFCHKADTGVSAVIYTCLALWGMLRPTPIILNHPSHLALAAS